MPRTQPITIGLNVIYTSNCYNGYLVNNSKPSDIIRIMNNPVTESISGITLVNLLSTISVIFSPFNINKSWKLRAKTNNF